MCRCASGERRRAGFTVIELLVVLAAMTVLLAIAVPRYVAQLDHAREVALKHDLRALREAIDQFRADQARAPASLDELVAKRYLRSLPVDPITQRADSWIALPSPAGDGLADIKSGAAGQAKDGTAYASW